MDKRNWSDAALVALTCPLEEGGAAPISHRALRALMSRGERDLSETMRARVAALLAGERAAEALLARYASRGIALLRPQDASWPEALGALRGGAPAYLFAWGDRSVLRGARVSLAGSREVGLEAAALAGRIGRVLAVRDRVLVSGAAEGCDLFAQEAALAAGGRAILFPAKRFSEAEKTPGCRRALAEGRALMLSATLPEHPFSPAKALWRNHFIYALGNPALVVAARDGLGGSWRGACDCLRGGWSRVGAFLGESSDFDGCRALAARGAQGLCVPKDDTELAEAILALGQRAEEQLRFTGWGFS